MRENTRMKNLMISEKTFDIVADPTQHHVGPTAEAPVPFINFAPLQNSLAKLQESVRAYSAAMNTFSSTDKLPSLEVQKSLDQSLIRTERAMTFEKGLPRRPWFKHQIYAPGFYTGYGVKTLPGVREAIEQRNWSEAADEIAIVAKTLDQVSSEIDRATEKLHSR
jgi:N-acetylated-alpha-linked acidic dipeptidase